LIVESENDKVISKRERERLKQTYPGAKVHTFHEGGHLSNGLFRVEETNSLIKDFLAEIGET